MIVSIIICTRNRADNLRQTLESLDSIDVPAGLRPEILVVDNGSTDDTAEVLQRRKASTIPIRRVFEPVPGQCRARNAGLSQSTGDIIIFTDDDIRFPKDWLPAMCEPIIAKKADGIAGNVELAPYLQRPWMTALHRAWLGSTERLDPLEPSEMVGASMAFARNVLDVVPSFDVELDPGALGFGGDTLFSFQLKKAGLKILRSKGPAVLHCFDEKRLSRSNWLRAAKDRGASNAYLDYHWRHQSLSLLPLLFFRNLARYYRRRVLRWRECLSQEGAPEWELHCLAGIHRLVRYSVESKRPRNYYREGLVKIRGVVERPKPLPVLGKSSITSAF
jgi:glycosyltransferase involved in cell wall biosynthesis